MSQNSSSSDPSIEGPSQIGQYEVTGRIGRGSFGVVYKGRDPYLKRDVAIKVCTVDDENLRQRFYREAEIAGKLEHDHVVAVHAFGFEDEAPYLVQEFLEGQDLSHLIRQRVAWSGQRKLEILAQIAGALAYAHEQGVIHRDVKPANVRVLTVDPEVKVKLMDFGIAKLAHDESQLTQKGVTIGTASYLPPEQVKGGDVDHRGDIFAFGVLAYELLTMERPFRGQTLSALVYQILYKAPRKLEDVWRGCPAELSQWVHKCLQKDPAARFGDFQQVLDALAPIREGAAAGRWPSLSEVWLPADALRGESSEASGERNPVEAPPPKASGSTSSGGANDPGSSETELEESIGSQTRVIQPGSASKVDFDATQPVASASAAQDTAAQDTAAQDTADGPVASDDPAKVPVKDTAAKQGFGQDGEPEAVDAAATRRVEMPPIPSRGDATDIPEELRTSAHEISKLVEAGDLEAAMAQLEETIHRQKGISTSAGVTGVLPTPPADANGGTGAVQIDAERPTTEIPRAATDAARAAGPPPPPLPGPGQPETADPKLTDPEPSRTQGPGVASASPATAAGTSASAVTGTSTSTTDGRAAHAATSTSTTGLPKRSGGKGTLILIIGAVAVAGVLAVVMGWWLGRESSGQTAVNEVEPPPAPEAPAETPETGLVVQSTPWAVVTEVSNSDGYVVELPEDASTPLFLPLAPGEYTVIVRYPEGNAEQSCNVQVTAEQSATCVTPFTQPTASDYFKDAGWWR